MEVNYPKGTKKNKYGGASIKPNGGSLVITPLNGLKIDFYNDGYDSDTYNLLNYNFSQLKIISLK